jgi:hypothetical protein
MVVTATPLPSTTLTAPIIGTRVATAIASPTPSLVAISVPTSAAVASETGQQDPPPGTVIAAGKRFTKDGISISVNQGLDLDPSGNGFAPDLVIQNGSGGEILVRWKNSFVHFRDDHGHEYRQWKRAQSDWDKNKQFAMPDGGSTQISPCFVGFLWPNGCYDRDEGFDWFLGRIDPSVSTLSLTIDQIGGMTNLNWVYQLH